MIADGGGAGHEGADKQETEETSPEKRNFRVQLIGFKTSW